ncbi:hypothetical protein ACWJWB_18165 [Clostridioides difficile]
MTKKNDEALGETTPQAVTDDTLDPAGFDLAAWLEGLAPAKAHYNLEGCEIVMQARTQTWRDEFIATHEKDEDAEQPNLEFLAAHIASPAGMTADVLRAMRETHAPEVDELATLALQLDTKPRSQIAPRFLPSASD